MRFGIKSMTMDDLARQMSISKKTLYQFFADKSELVRMVLITHLDRDRDEIIRIYEENENAIEELFKVIKLVSSKLVKIHPSIHFDLEKYYPEAWKAFKEHKNNFIFKSLTRNMEKGIRTGLYRDDFDVAVIAKIYISRIDSVFDPEVFPPDQYHFSKVYFEMVTYHLRGISTAKGLEILDQKLKELSN